MGHADLQVLLRYFAQTSEGIAHRHRGFEAQWIMQDFDLKVLFLIEYFPIIFKFLQVFKP